MCAERDPLICHRFILVSKVLRDLGVNVTNILSIDKVESFDDSISRLMIEEKVQPDMLFGDQTIADLASRALTSRGAKIAYKVDSDHYDHN